MERTRGLARRVALAEERVEAEESLGFLEGVGASGGKGDLVGVVGVVVGGEGRFLVGVVGERMFSSFIDGPAPVGVSGLPASSMGEVGFVMVVTASENPSDIISPKSISSFGDVGGTSSFTTVTRRGVTLRERPRSP